MSVRPEYLSRHIKEKALELGFSACGIAHAHELQSQQQYLQSWTEQGLYAGMNFMTRNEAVRLNPALLVEDAKSVISCAYNYYPSQKQNPDTYQISKYAYGNDYHGLLKTKLYELLHVIQEKNKYIHGRAFVDSAPLLEKQWAVQAGLGWIGKNGLLIIKGQGSFIFLGELVLDIELEYDKPFEHNYCGNCNRCIDTCPNHAIVTPRKIDARKCISYLTIEHKGDIPKPLLEKSNYIFGCDICQDVCPWNRFAKPCNEPAFNLSPEVSSLTKEAFENLSETTFNSLFPKLSVLQRAGYAKFKQTIACLNRNPINS